MDMRIASIALVEVATIVQAVLKITYRKRNGPRKADVLRQFQAKGYWLMDAVEHPINKIGDKRIPERERKNLIEDESPNLLKRISALGLGNHRIEMAVVLIKNLVYECLVQPLRQAGCWIPQHRAIGFPRWYEDENTIKGISNVLVDHHLA